MDGILNSNSNSNTNKEPATIEQLRDAMQVIINHQKKFGQKTEIQIMMNDFMPENDAILIMGKKAFERFKSN